MKIKLKSKRVIKRMLGAGAYRHGIPYQKYLELQACGFLNSTYGWGSYCTEATAVLSFEGHLYIPKKFIGKVKRK